MAVTQLSWYILWEICISPLMVHILWWAYDCHTYLIVYIMWKADDCISEALVWEGYADVTQDSLLLYYGC